MRSNVLSQAVAGIVTSLLSFPLVAAAQVPPMDGGVAEAEAPPDVPQETVTAPLPEVTPPPEPPPLPPPPPPPPPATEAPLSPVVAGWHNDLFFLADAGHQWFIVPTGRLQLDGYGYVGDSITDDYTTGAAMAFHRGDVKDTFLIRRARIELVGGLFDRFTYMVGADFASANAPLATDDFVNGRVFPELQFQFGQYDAPFTLENRTSDKYIDFMERSLAVRALGIPTNKEVGLMAWGEDPNRVLYYSAGVFAGDGQNRTNRDDNLDVMGRVFAHPLIQLGGPLAQLQIGASFRYGQRGRSVDYAYPSMSTQAQWTFMNPVLVGGATPITMVPDSGQLGVAGEIDLPIEWFDFRSELVYVSNGTREMSGAVLSGDAQRLGDFTGIGFYAQLGFWLWGTPGINGRPGYQNPPSLRLDHADAATQPLGLQAVARFDMVDARYSGGSRGSNGGGAPAADGRYSVYALELGLNLWLTKHVRISLDYLQYFFPNQPGMTAGPDDNRAHGPHNNASTFGEVTARVGLVL